MSEFARGKHNDENSHRATPVIATWLRDDIASITYPGIGGGSRGSLIEPYWRTAAVFFAASRKANPEARHLLYSNVQPPVVDGVNLQAFLRSLGVEFMDTPFATPHPKSSSEIFGGQFYVFDILAHLVKTLGSSAFLLLDLDCLFIAPADPLFRTVELDGIATYVVEELAADSTFDNNGLSLEELRDIGNAIAATDRQRIQPCGGEIVGARAPAAVELVATLDWAWKTSLERQALGEPRFITEEHVISFACAHMNGPVGNANGMIRRIWTQRAYRNPRADDLDLVIWHLPAEKKYGFSTLFRDVTKQSSRFWSQPLGDEYVDYLGRHVGVPHTTLKKRFADGLAAVSDRIPIAHRKRL